VFDHRVKPNPLPHKGFDKPRVLSPRVILAGLVAVDGREALVVQDVET